MPCLEGLSLALTAIPTTILLVCPNLTLLTERVVPSFIYHYTQYIFRLLQLGTNYQSQVWGPSLTMALPIFIQCFAIFYFSTHLSAIDLFSMGLHQLISALIFASVLARVELSTCHVLKGSVTCLDCNPHYDLSDIKVLVKCSQVKKLAMATTTANGTFETELPSDAQPPPSFNCLASVFGGPSQLYVSRKNMVSRTTKLPQSASYTISTPLKFHTSCPLPNKDIAKCGPRNAVFGSSKTVDLPLPPEWGLAPSSYYFPFMPIIGIP